MEAAFALLNEWKKREERRAISCGIVRGSQQHLLSYPLHGSPRINDSTFLCLSMGRTILIVFLLGLRELMIRSKLENI